jgi:hypothetical protein
MNKLIQVGITSIILIALFFAAALTWEACSGKATTKTLEEKAEDAFDKHGSEDEFFEEDLSEDNTYEEGAETTGFNSESEDNTTLDYSEVEDKDETTSYEPDPEPIRRATMAGKYLIIAGNFLVENNANEMVNKLVNMGYNSAEVSVFDYSQYYTVIASRSDDYGLASSLSSELKTKGIDNYVHTRK